MDTLTQGLLGATCGQALYGRRLGKSAITWGALVGMVPDLDMLATPSRRSGSGCGTAGRPTLSGSGSWSARRSGG